VYESTREQHYLREWQLYIVQKGKQNGASKKDTSVATKVAEESRTHFAAAEKQHTNTYTYYIVNKRERKMEVGADDD